MARKTATDQRLDDLSKQLDDGFERMEKALTKHAEDDKETFKDHNGRLSKMETSYAGLLGKLAIIATILSIAGAAVAKKLIG
jgi:hypothetical protein